MVPEDRERALKLVKKGDEAMADGLVAPARLLYERAADLGLAQAAMALAGTYDAAELTRPNLRGIRPDAKEAKRWYERARQLGAGDANERLRRLGAN
jgi:TPR repeat protein